MKECTYIQTILAPNVELFVRLLKNIRNRTLENQQYLPTSTMDASDNIKFKFLNSD